MYIFYTYTRIHKLNRENYYKLQKHAREMILANAAHEPTTELGGGS